MYRSYVYTVPLAQLSSAAPSHAHTIFLMRRLSFLSTTFHHHQNPHIQNQTNFIRFLSPLNLIFSNNNNNDVRPRPSRTHHITTTNFHHRRLKKVVVIMGPTGSGKSKLSVDLAGRFFPFSEIINSDKMQVYRGLDITTNKIPMHDRNCVVHHLIGDFDPTPTHPEFTPSDFRLAASAAISNITSRRRLPLVVGGSNSFIYALLSRRFLPEIDVFDESSTEAANSVCSELRYRCCFIWVDVSPLVLNQYLSKRVDDMLDSGMLDELAQYFRSGLVSHAGLGKAIGVAEFERYFERFGCRRISTNLEGINDDDDEDLIARSRLYDEAVSLIKYNTCQLAKRQLGKIQRLKDAGWDLRKIDATAAFREAMDDSGGGRRDKMAEIWDRQVLEPSVKIVKQFLEEE